MEPMGFEELRAFLVVVDEGSFLSAAVTLGVSRTTLRRQVDALEASAGVLLLQRNRKGVVLTEAGRQLVTSGRVMQQEFSALLHSIRATGHRPAGVVRILLPVGLPPMAMTALYGLIRANWPEVHVRLRFREAPLQASLSDVDVVAWFGEGAPSGAWITHTLLTARQRLLAGRSYLAARGVPRTIEDLARHDLLTWTAPDEPEPRLVTVGGASIPIQPTLASTNIHLLHECALAGQGIAWAPDANLPIGPDREPLVPVLEELIGRDLVVRVAVPRTLADVPKVRVIIDHLESMRSLLFAPPPPAAPRAGGPPAAEVAAAPDGRKSARRPR